MDANTHLNILDNQEREHAKLKRYFYICPNQFDGDDEASEEASSDEAVDVKLDDYSGAIAHATRLAAKVGHRVVVEIAVEFPSGRCESERYASVLTDGRIIEA